MVNLLLAYGGSVVAPVELQGFKRGGTILHWVAKYSGSRAGLDWICAVFVMAGGPAARVMSFRTVRMNWWVDIRRRRCIPRIVRKARVRKALLGGRKHEILSVWRDGFLGRREFGMIVVLLVGWQRWGGGGVRGALEREEKNGLYSRHLTPLREKLESV